MPKKNKNTQLVPYDSAVAEDSKKKSQKQKEKEIEDTPPKKREKKPGNPNGLKATLVMGLWWTLAFLSVVFLLAGIAEDAGLLIEGFCTLVYGLFGYGGLLIVCFFAFLAIEWRKIVEKRHLGYKLCFLFLFILFTSVFFHVIAIMNGGVSEPSFPSVLRATDHWFRGKIIGGGVIGGFVGGLFYLLMRGWVSLILCLLLMITSLLFFFEVTPLRVIRALTRFIRERDERALAREKSRGEKERLRGEKDKLRDERDQMREERENLRAERERREEERLRAAAEKKAAKAAMEADAKEKERASHAKDHEKRKRDIEFNFMVEEEPTSEEKPDIIEATAWDVDEKETDSPDKGASTKSEKEDLLFDFDNIPDEKDEAEDTWNHTDFGFGNEDGEIDLSRFFADPAPAPTPTSDGSVTTDAPLEAEDESDEEDLPFDPDPATPVSESLPEKPKYIFPPTSLLSPNENPKTEDDREELMRNARKLVEVLKSFRVDTEIVNISRGPTITRYELAPKVGVRVRAIANLVDDIALNLETSGVRIEAPIPGKAAVGVEVPNKAQATVYLRDLIESEAFRNAKSKLTACVGMDVSGAPVLMDIAKMPHLLIAGATGMGKSVGVNSIIMSLLYKASPDELKLILVDPKKVELNMYNKLPHLLIPVVNNPKKAAGALATAVNEMERRFELIESVGVRDIKGYNKLTETDPTREFLPHIVIIIDELADLMMTAKDDVEDSICRIAQKARAAGIHLIICTQRPSVDVITGLIKANVPSRIAFTVASNIDSRTIIDIAGAEKLIGRGDMLFAPVGAMKPMRVQGAFVSDKEVEAVTDFIKNQTQDVRYDDSFLNQVEIEAERCGQQKKKVAAEEIDGDEELDPKYYDAVEIALEMGKISTSLLQRRLSLGYGRAAKIIDKMEQMGVVGPQEGQKPRNILISRQDYQEMIMRRDDAAE